jgi:hypothetical protein
MSFKKPRPRPPQEDPARITLPPEARTQLAKKAEYVGSPHHTDIPKYGMQNNPRTGSTTIDSAEEQGIKNPTCIVCPRKWARRKDEAQALLRSAIEAGNFIAPLDDGMPTPVWARDPETSNVVYEAKLSHPPNGYKAYPLTQFQAQYNLPFRLP